MSKKLLYKFTLPLMSSFALAFLSACGDETTNVTNTMGMSIIEKKGKIPECTKESAGNMIYVSDSAAAFFCADGEWQTLKGDKGEKGEKGQDGLDGDDGSSCLVSGNETHDGYDIICDNEIVGYLYDGSVGPEGDRGIDGLSAYQLAVKNGFTGTEQEWLESLKGSGSNNPEQGSGKNFLDGWMIDARDKQLYRTVTIGDQTWMAENLNYAYTEPIEGYDSSSFCFAHKSENCDVYGRLYPWSAAMDSIGSFDSTGRGCGSQEDCDDRGVVRGVCPEGWHIPDTTETRILISAVKGTEMEKIFTAQPAGQMVKNDDYAYSFNNQGSLSMHWTSKGHSNKKTACTLFFGEDNDTHQFQIKINAIAVRCIKD